MCFTILTGISSDRRNTRHTTRRPPLRRDGAAGAIDETPSQLARRLRFTATNSPRTKG